MKTKLAAAYEKGTSVTFRVSAKDCGTLLMQYEKDKLPTIQRAALAESLFRNDEYRNAMADMLYKLAKDLRPSPKAQKESKAIKSAVATLLEIERWVETRPSLKDDFSGGLALFDKFRKGEIPPNVFLHMGNPAMQMIRRWEDADFKRRRKAVTEVIIN